MATAIADLGFVEFADVLTEVQQAQLSAEVQARMSARPFRELSLYSDYLHGKVVKPDDVVDAEMAGLFVDTAERGLRSLAPFVSANCATTGRITGMAQTEPSHVPKHAQKA